VEDEGSRWFPLDEFLPWCELADIPTRTMEIVMFYPIRGMSTLECQAVIALAQDSTDKAPGQDTHLRSNSPPGAQTAGVLSFHFVKKDTQ
jgi:hypothetical protein